MVEKLPGVWQKSDETRGGNYRCGHCGADVGPSRYYFTNENPQGFVFVCPACNRPTYICDGLSEQTPGPLAGRSIAGISNPEVEKLYLEARKALANGAPSASVMVCRKLLMHVAVEQGAEPDKGFRYYAKYLSDEGVVGTPFAGVVKHIADQGNKENHELEVRSPNDARTLLLLTEFVLASIYELPGMLPSPEGTDT